MNKIVGIVAVATIVTFLIRSVPFLFFRKKDLPDLIIYFGRYLPFALMPLLVVFALKEVNPFVYPYGLPELIASLLVIILHFKFKKLALSIGFGTLAYMFLVQIAFA
ncbi:MAG: AzlD domain-containing protein [Anaerococcus sp.]|nr:AzlD domain-containing protein [Anaerococcus sp.]MDD7045291.1 AzlD domain-containing protein [Peptoniphilaceae bacterium]MDY2918235.1 AzlD domain-containing protein [Anaerococcus sp.]